MAGGQKVSCGRDLCCVPDINVSLEDVLKTGYVFFAICYRPSVCRLSVTFVRPAIEIFGNVSTPFGTLAIYDLSVKILRRSSQGNPSVGGGEGEVGIIQD